jgi:hypothetical protein
MSKCWPPWQCLKRFAVIFLVVWHMYTMMRWLNSHELFFSLFSPCKNIKVSFYFIFLSNLIPILLLVICFIFLFFYWLFFSISSLIIWFYLIFISNLILIFLIVFFYPFPDHILFSIPSLSIWFQIIFILNLVLILFIAISFVLEPFLLNFFLSILSPNILLI